MVSQAQDYPYWPPYLIHDRCQLFTGSGCPDVITGALHAEFQVGIKKRAYSGIRSH